jgi:DNA-binding transcriptional LysR family regulator
VDRLVGLEVFARVVEEGSLAGAARRLGLAPSAVTAHVQALEARLGVRLLDRNTRGAVPTWEGRAFHQRITVLLDELAASEVEVGAARTAPRGHLRLNASVAVAAHLGGLVASFAALHPEVSVELVATDRYADLVEEGFDVALRIGPLPDSAYVARHLAPAPLVLCAAPSYLARHGAPAQPSDLAGHHCLNYARFWMGDDWQFETGDGRVERVRICGRLRANSVLALRAAALGGHGIVLLPRFALAAELAAGHLVRLLPGYPVPEPFLTAVHPHRALQPAKLRVFLDVLAEGLRGGLDRI